MTPQDVHDAIVTWWGDRSDVRRPTDPWNSNLEGEVPGLGYVKTVEFVYLGDEDCSGPVQHIVQVGDVFYAKWGDYRSHIGTEFDAFGEFTPVERREVVRTSFEWS